MKGLAGGHGMMKTFPMRGPKAFGNEEVQGFSENLAGGVSKNGLCATVPEADQAVMVCVDDAVRRLIQNVCARNQSFRDHHRDFISCCDMFLKGRSKGAGQHRSGRIL
jgi:hypothetical protein